MVAQRTKGQVEYGASEGLSKKAMLLLERAGTHHLLQINPIGAGQEMAQPDEMAKQSMTIDVPREHRDAAAADASRAPALPIGPRFVIEMEREKAPIGADIGGVISFPKIR